MEGWGGEIGPICPYDDDIIEGVNELVNDERERDVYLVTAVNEWGGNLWLENASCVVKRLNQLGWDIVRKKKNRQEKKR